MDTALVVVFQIVVLLYSVVIHEVSHGVMANALGDPTAKYLGRLTLNPFKHLDLFGSVLLPLFLFLVRSPFLFGYAKPVPYNPQNLTDRRYGPAKVAFAGPASNLVLAVLFGTLIRFVPAEPAYFMGVQLLSYIVVINLVLAVFNLVPIPPLDGHWLLMTFLPARFVRTRVFLYRNGLLLLFAVVLFVFPLIFQAVAFLFRLITGVAL